MSVCKFIDRHMYINIPKYMYYVHVYIENISQRTRGKLVASVASREQKQLAGGETGWRGTFFFLTINPSLTSEFGIVKDTLLLIMR